MQETGVSNETLAAIATIAMIYKCNEMHDQWKIHMKGLGELVRARGGLNSLGGEPLLLGKLYRFVSTANTDLINRESLMLQQSGSEWINRCIRSTLLLQQRGLLSTRTHRLK